MVKRPYTLVAINTHTGNDSKTASFSVGVNETFHAKSLAMTATSAAANITEIVDGSGIAYGNLDSTNSIPVALYIQSATNFRSPLEFESEITLTGGNKLYIKTLDSSGAGNTIKICIFGFME